MLSRRSSLCVLLAALLVLHSCSAMSIRQLYDRAVGREQAATADSGFGFLQHDDIGEARHRAIQQPEGDNSVSGSSGDIRLPFTGVSRMLRRFVMDYSTELE
ncbi:hypothetical protein QR680_004610 [Steinernema hermaphroditum]|uniref:Uncharacterized protein n=1 Tax=Steinernema hermaphroditum TaxID=289476 RepID=A0AA39HRF0_9BILA|nr:hypothetical protein QR680_004610 [Steinernema hermaphroditum]